MREAAQVAETIRRKGSVVLSFLALGAVAYFGEKGYDGGFIKDLWTQAKLASPFAAMLALYAWQREVRDRKEAQEQCADRTVDFIKTANTGFRAIDKMAAAVEKRSGRR